MAAFAAKDLAHTFAVLNGALSGATYLAKGAAPTIADAAAVAAIAEVRPPLPRSCAPRSCDPSAQTLI